MKVAKTVQAGFSAVELLITLFIAGLFIIAGNQLYVFVISSGEEANKRTKASNVGYEYLRSKGQTVSKPCTLPAPATTVYPVTVEGLTQVTVTVTFTCPYTSTATDQAPLRNITKITSTTKYGSPQNEVIHAIYKTQ